MISKELLSKVLEENISEVYKMGSNPNFKQNTLLFKLYGCGELCNINIYELAHKCKEWAKNKNSDNGGPVGGYTLFSKSGDKWNKAVCYCDEIRLSIPTQQANSEPEAIFKACEWILDNKDSK